MRAAIVHEVKGTPKVEDFAAPAPQDGAQIIQVSAGAIGPTDLMKVSGLAVNFYGPFKGPKIMGGEGVGRLANGQRVYFGHSLGVYGAWGEQTLVSDAEIWPIPDGLTDEQILPLGISGTGALIPLEEAKIQPGERVLILGGTGPLGQIALQLARYLGAGTVIAAGRGISALEHVMDAGLADDVVQLGEGDDEAALKTSAGDGYNVVLDCVYGAPAVAALRATAKGGRVLSIGVAAGPSFNVELRDLIYRTHAGVATGNRPAAERRAAFERVLGYALKHGIKVETQTFPLEQAGAAWEAQAKRPHGKIIVEI